VPNRPISVKGHLLFGHTDTDAHTQSTALSGQWSVKIRKALRRGLASPGGEGAGAIIRGRKRELNSFVCVAATVDDRAICRGV